MTDLSRSFTSTSARVSKRRAPVGVGLILAAAVSIGLWTVIIGGLYTLFG